MLLLPLLGQGLEAPRVSDRQVQLLVELRVGRTNLLELALGQRAAVALALEVGLQRHRA
jgi:hypothetical protein